MSIRKAQHGLKYFLSHEVRTAKAGVSIPCGKCKRQKCKWVWPLLENVLTAYIKNNTMYIIA